MFLHSQIEETSSKVATVRTLACNAINPFAEAHTGHYMKQVIMEIRVMGILVFLSCYIPLKSHINQDVQNILSNLGKCISRCCNMDTLKDFCQASVQGGTHRNFAKVSSLKTVSICLCIRQLALF